MKNKFYSMTKSENEVDIHIYGDITSYPFEDSAPTAKSLATMLNELTDVSRINVYINSYGGEVAEGLAIYHALSRHNAKIVTYCDGFAASIASVIFMAGNERIMNEASILMIHNAWSFCEGNAEQLRKQADDLEKITQASVTIYKAHSTLSEEEIKKLMDNESWILPEEALKYGFATRIEKTDKKTASQNAKIQLLDIIKKYRQEIDSETDEEEEKPDTDDEDEEIEEAIDEEDEEEKPDDTEEQSDDEETSDDEDTKQRINKFFNAILKM